MNDSGVKIEVHLIQNFAPSNLNRDDTGQPGSRNRGRGRVRSGGLHRRRRDRRGVDRRSRRGGADV